MRQRKSRGHRERYATRKTGVAFSLPRTFKSHGGRMGGKPPCRGRDFAMRATNLPSAYLQRLL